MRGVALLYYTLLACLVAIFGETGKPGFLPNGCPETNMNWLLPHETDCTLFYICNWGGLVLRQCGPGTHFNRALQICDWPQNAKCTTSSASISNPTISQPATPGSSMQGPTTPGPSMQGLTTPGPSMQLPTTPGPSMQELTTPGPSMQGPTTPGPSMQGPTTPGPSMQEPTTPGPTMQGPTTPDPAMQGPTTPGPTMQGPTSEKKPTTSEPIPPEITAPASAAPEQSQS